MREILLALEHALHAPPELNFVNKQRFSLTNQLIQSILLPVTRLDLRQAKNIVVSYEGKFARAGAAMPDNMREKNKIPLPTPE